MKKLICIGLQKTGTSSFTEAAKILGFKPAIHGGAEKYNKPDLQLYAEGETNKIVDTLSKYNSMSDVPGALVWRELYEKHPNSYFILTTRSSPEKWWTSVYNHYSSKDPDHECRHEYSSYVLYGIWRLNKGYKDKCISVYNKHNEEIRNFFKNKNNFTEICIDTDNKWEKLCGLLNMRIPKKPYPHKNKTKHRR
ncbi:MAG: sulfotransferase family protein [bacterium]